MPNLTDEGAQVPDDGQQPHLFGYANGTHLASSHSLSELDKALNYEIRVVSGNANRQLANEIATHLKVRITNATVTHFSDGETRVAIEDNVRGKGLYMCFSFSQYTLYVAFFFFLLVLYRFVLNNVYVCVWIYCM